MAICFVEAGPDGVTDLRFVMNPDKLAFAAAQLSRIDLTTGVGLPAAVEDVGTVVHLATSLGVATSSTLAICSPSYLGRHTSC